MLLTLFSPSIASTGGSQQEARLCSDSHRISFTERRHYYYGGTRSTATFPSRRSSSQCRRKLPDLWAELRSYLSSSCGAFSTPSTSSVRISIFYELVNEWRERESGLSVKCLPVIFDYP